MSANYSNLYENAKALENDKKKYLKNCFALNLILIVFLSLLLILNIIDIKKVDFIKQNFNIFGNEKIVILQSFTIAKFVNIFILLTLSVAICISFYNLKNNGVCKSNFSKINILIGLAIFFMTCFLAMDSFYNYYINKYFTFIYLLYIELILAFALMLVYIILLYNFLKYKE